MRITSGKHKNRKIETTLKKKKDLDYRPTTERTRLAIFNILQNSKHIPIGLLEDANVVDLCCGCGSFGIEAISRGAEKVLFIDNAQEQFDLVEQNLKSINEFDKAILFKGDSAKLPKINFKADYAYIDPPYNVDLCRKTLISLIASDILKDKAIVVLERSYKERFEPVDELVTFDEREYGKSVITFYEYNGK